MHEQGAGVAQDPAEALQWCRMATELGYAKAQVNLAYQTLNGTGGAQDHAETAR